MGPGAPTPGGRGRRRAAWAAGGLAYLALPLVVDDYWLSVLVVAGITAVAAVGLNLLTGYCGQVSLGHAFFVGAGAYVAAVVGSTAGLPLALWLPAATAVGAALGAATGPFALRFSGHLLAVVTLAVLFAGQHVFRNWTWLTGGGAGRSDLPIASLGPFDLSALVVAGHRLSFDQGYFWLVWAVVAVVVAASANLVRSRMGRAMVAVREDDRVAAVLGIDVARTKVTAFALAGALAALAGALHGSYRQYVGPEEWDLLASIEYLAVVLVGGLGTVGGPVAGALFLGAVPHLVAGVSGALPFVARGAEPGVTVGQLDRLSFGVVIVAFVLAEPRGLVALGHRLRARLAARPRTRPRPGPPAWPPGCHDGGRAGDRQGRLRPSGPARAGGEA